VWEIRITFPADKCNLQYSVKLRTLDVKKRPFPKISFYAVVNQLPDDGQKKD